MDNQRLYLLTVMRSLKALTTSQKRETKINLTIGNCLMIQG